MFNAAAIKMPDLPKRRWLSVTEFADEIGCKCDLIYEAVRKGIVRTSHTPQGYLRIDYLSQRGPFLDHHPQLLQRILDNRKRIVARKEIDSQEIINRAKRVLEANVMSEGDNGTANNIPSVGESLAVLKLRKEQALARKAEVVAAVAEGRVIEYDKVKIAWRDIAVKVRKAVLSIADRIAPMIAAEHDPHRCHLLLTKEFKHALRNLGEEIVDNPPIMENDNGSFSTTTNSIGIHDTK